MLSASATIAMLGGCGSGSSLAPTTTANGGGSTTQSLDRHHAGQAVSVELPGTKLWKLGEPRPSWMKFQAPAGPKGFAYVAYFNGGNIPVNEFYKNNKNNMNPTPVCSVAYPTPGYVNDIGVDFSSNLWIPVGINGASGFTQEYGPNCGPAIGAQLTGGHGQPAAVAFDSADAFEYVENITSQANLGNIDVYPAGSTTPSDNLTDANATEAIGEAVDAAGDVFMAYLKPSSGGGTVADFVGGHNPAVELSQISNTFPGGVAMDSAQNLLVSDQKTGAVAVYAPPYTGSAIATFAVHPSVFCKFGHLGKRFYCGDYINSTTDVYTYDVTNPGATTYTYSFAVVQVGQGNEGVALDKPEAD